MSTEFNEINGHIFIFYAGDGQTNCSNYDGMEPGLILRDGAGGENWNGVTNLPAEAGGGSRGWTVLIIMNHGNQPDVYAADVTFFLENIGITVDESWAGRIHYGGGSGGGGRANSFFNHTTSNPYRTFHSTGIWMSTTLYTVSANSPENNYCWYGDEDTNPGTPPSFTINVFNQLPGVENADKFLGVTVGGGHGNDTWHDCMSVSGTTVEDNRWIWMIVEGENLIADPVYPVGTLLPLKRYNFYDLVQANKPNLWKLIDGDTSTEGLTDFYNGFIWDAYKNEGLWIDLDTFVNHPRIRIANTNNGGVTVRFQFFNNYLDTTRHTAEYSTTLPSNNWKWVDSVNMRTETDSMRFLRVIIDDGGANGFSEIEVYANILGEAPDIKPTPTDEPDDPGAVAYQWYGKLAVDTLLDNAGGGQRIQNDRGYNDTAANSQGKKIIYNRFANSTNATLLPSNRAGLKLSVYFANVSVEHENPPGNVQRKDMPFGADSMSTEAWQTVYNFYYGIAAKFGRNTSANIDGYTFSNTNAGIGQNLIHELEVNNEIMQHWSGNEKYHNVGPQLMQQRAGYYGTKAADPTMLVNLGAMTGLREDRGAAYYFKSLLTFKSKDSIFFDKLSANEYLTTAGQQNSGESNIDGMTPEEWGFLDRLNSFRINIRDRYFPGIPLLLTEMGYDTHESEYNVIDIPGKTRRQTQADWVWRTQEVAALARWSRHVQYSQRDGAGGGPFGTTGYSYDTLLTTGAKNVFPASFQSVFPPNIWDNGGYCSPPKESYWKMTWRLNTLRDYYAWPISIASGDTTNPWCLRYTHLTNPNEKTYSAWVPKKRNATVSNYQISVPGAVSATMITYLVGDTAGTETSLPVVNDVVTIPLLTEGGAYVRVAFDESANQSPTAAAGNDQTITLPISQVTVNGSSSSDPDGTISTYLWTKISGPVAYTITSPNSASTTITGLVAGTYVFRLTVTDNESATDTDDITVTVNAASVVRNRFKGSLKNRFRN